MSEQQPDDDHTIRCAHCGRVLPYVWLGRERIYDRAVYEAERDTGDIALCFRCAALVREQ